MKILILSFYYPPDLCAGSFRTGELVSALNSECEKDTSIEVITTVPNRYSSYRPDNLPDFEEDGLRVHRVDLPNHKSGMKDQAVAFLHYAKAALRLTRRKNYDLVFATSSRLMTGTLGAVISRKCGSRLHLDIRDIFTDTIVDVVRQKVLIKIILPILKFVEGWTYRSADEINVVSKGFMDDVLEISPQSTVTTFTNGIDNEFLDRDFSHKIARKKTLITYAGNFGESQGLQYIIPIVAAEIQEFAQFQLIGDGGKKCELIAAIEDVGVNNIAVHDPVSRDSLLGFYADTDILFFCLNDRDAFLKVLPSKLFEYAATGKPILAGVAGHAADFIKENVPGCEIFPPGNVDAMIDKLGVLMAGPKHYERASFKEKFSRKKIMRDYAVQLLKKRKA